MNLTAERLRYARKRAGLTIKELSGYTGISEKSLTRYEKGDSTPDTHNSKQLASAFYMSLDYILGFSDDPCCNLTEDYRQKWYQYQQTLSNKILINQEYYWVQFDPKTEPIPLRGAMHWCGRDQSGADLYGLRPIKPSECERLILSMYKENILIINNEADWESFLLHGINAFVSEEICNNFVPYLMSPGTVTDK